MEIGMVLLLAAALGLFGVVAGIYVSALIHDHRVADLGASQYVAMHQMRDKTFRRVMPAIGLATLALVLLSVLFAMSSGLPFVLAVPPRLCSRSISSSRSRDRCH
jgi:hypothetical protein